VPKDDGVRRANILGVGVNPVDIPSALSRISAWIAAGEAQYVCVTGVHGVIESRLDENVRRIHNDAGMVVPDGMPLVWLSRWQGYPQVDRVYGPDLMLAACEMSLDRGWRHFLYGGGPGVVERLAARLQSRFPGLQIVGTDKPPFRPLEAAEKREIIEAVRRSGAQIVWVGISTPKQELLMAELVEDLGGPVLIGVGAAFDFHAGLKRQAPRWMQRAGLEWLFRLCTEPRRLWRRYLRNNSYFLWLLLLQALGVRKYRLEGRAR
jgi:N-acetylglucosaminyldiphosphoundecaprenol N-acetyl-beta-D-mannosaminyltransferase